MGFGKWILVDSINSPLHRWQSHGKVRTLALIFESIATEI